MLLELEQRCMLNYSAPDYKDRGFLSQKIDHIGMLTL